MRLPTLALTLSLTLVAAPALGDACESHFRAGLAAGEPLDARLSAIEATLYRGLGWVNRSAVLQRLENRSALTSACQEIDAVQGELLGIARRLDEAERAFRLAVQVCWGINHTRAQQNLDALSDVARALSDLRTYLNSLPANC